MSKLEVDAIEPQSGTTITIGASGDTVNLVGTLKSNGSPLPGDISEVVAGTGLSGGGTSGAVTINIDSAQPTITSLGTITSFRSTGIDDNSNALAMTIDSSERIGIGTSSPAHNLEIVTTASGSVNDSLQIRNNSAASGTGSRIRFINSTDSASDANGASISCVRIGVDNDLVFETENSEAMRIDHTGKVGIGTTSPGQTLTVAGDLTVQKSGDNLKADFSNGINANFRISTAGTVAKIGPSTTSDVAFVRSSNEYMRITSAGLVGIGTSNPSQKLEVSGTNNIIQDNKTSTSTGIAGIQLKGSDASSYLKVFHLGPSFGGTTFGGVTGNNQSLIEAQGVSSLAFTTQGGTPDIIFAPARTARMTIKNDGKVGIGTASPAGKLDVAGTIIGDALQIDGDAVIQKASGDVSLTIQANENSGNREPTLNLRGANSSSNPIIQFGDSTSYTGSIQYENQDNSMQFGTNSSECMRIKSDGNVGIGGVPATVNQRLFIEGNNSALIMAEIKNIGGPSALQITANNGTDARVVFGDLADNGRGRIIYSNSDESMQFAVNNLSEKMRISSAGAVSIASSNVTQNAHLNVRQDTNGHAIRTYLSATVGSGALSSIKYIRAIPAVSAGTQLIIPFIAQNNINSKTYVHVRGLSCESNTRDPKAFECKFAVGHTSNLNNLTVLQNLGKCTGASISGMNIVLAFNVDYTHSGDSGMFIELDYIAHHQDASINLSGIVMN